MNNFIFENKTKVYFGKGGVKEYLGCVLDQYGEVVMLAYGGGSIKRNGVYDEVMGILNQKKKRVVEFSGIMPNPTYAKVQEGAALARENHVDLILAVVGGSVSDCCKIVSAQAMLDEDIWEMQTVKHTYPSKFIPLATIVTVFGTGSEMNNGAVITHEEKKIKGALWGAQADVAFLDPELFDVGTIQTGHFRCIRYLKPCDGDVFRQTGRKQSVRRYQRGRDAQRYSQYPHSAEG